VACRAEDKKENGMQRVRQKKQLLKMDAGTGTVNYAEHTSNLALDSVGHCLPDS
jgi:hypothetical protein